MKISLVSLRFWYSTSESSSKRARRALLLAWRPFGFWRTHSSSFFIALVRASSVFCSCSRRCFLLLEPGRVVALVRDARAAVELEDPLGGVVEEVAVVGDGDDGAREALQELLEPVDALGVEVVGGLVEQQHVGLGQQHAAQRDAALLAARELADHRIPRRQAQRVGGDLELQVGVLAAGRRRSAPRARPARRRACRSRRRARRTRRRPRRGASSRRATPPMPSSTASRTVWSGFSTGSCGR